MSQRGMVIDGLEFARRQGVLSGHLRLDALPRLAEVLFDVSGGLDYVVSGASDGGIASLSLQLRGPLRLICQRCLGALDFALNVRGRLMLIEPGAHWPSDDELGGLEDETCDAVEASREMDLAPMLEEEILLALPLAPRHEDCKPPAAKLASVSPSPFAQLAKLKRN